MKKTEKNKVYNNALDGRLRCALPIALMALAAAFIVYGIFDGETAAVFNKAINLCRQCVGIG